MVPRYVDKVLGPQASKSSKDKEFFYTDSKVKYAYKRYLQGIVTRKNQLTGLLSSTFLHFASSCEAYGLGTACLVPTMPWKFVSIPRQRIGV